MVLVHRRVVSFAAIVDRTIVLNSLRDFFPHRFTVLVSTSFGGNESDGINSTAYRTQAKPGIAVCLTCEDGAVQSLIVVWMRRYATVSFELAALKKASMCWQA